MREETLILLEEFYNKYPLAMVGPTPIGEIEAASKQLRVTFSLQYIDYICKYGGGYLRYYSIYGVRDFNNKNNTVVTYTNLFRSFGLPEIEQWYIISNDGFGNPIGILPNEQIWISILDEGTTEFLSDNFEKFILNLFLA